VRCRIAGKSLLPVKQLDAMSMLSRVGGRVKKRAREIGDDGDPDFQIGRRRSSLLWRTTNNSNNNDEEDGDELVMMRTMALMRTGVKSNEGPIIKFEWCPFFPSSKVGHAPAPGIHGYG